MPGYGLVDVDYARRLREAAGRTNDTPLYMLSMAKYQDGYGPRPGWETYRDPDSELIPVSLLMSVGAAVCFLADVVAGPADWDRVGVIWFPNRRSFTEVTQHRDMTDWRSRKERRVARGAMLGTLPIDNLPVADGQRVLLEIWNGPPPAPVADGKSAAFLVDGTYIGDGRQWNGVRYTSVEPGTALPWLSARFGYQVLLLEPIIERWR